MHGPWLKWAIELSHFHIQGHNKLAIQLHLLRRKQRNPMCPMWDKEKIISKHWQPINVHSPTPSPPLAKLIRGMSWRATTSFVSNDRISKHLEDMLRVTLLPANSKHGDALTHCWTFLSTCRFFGVFVLIASQTRWMHSLEQFKFNHQMTEEFSQHRVCFSRNLLGHLRSCLKIQNFHRCEYFNTPDIFYGEWNAFIY